MKKSIIAAFAAGVLAAVILFSVTGCFGTLKVNTGSYTTDTSVEKKLAEMKSVIDAYAIDEFDEEKAEELLTLAGFTADKVEDVTLAEDEKGELLGAVLNVTSTEGYGGDISFSMGILKDGTVSGIQILSISETAGLGMRAKEESFYGQFAEKNAEKFSYTKTGASAEDEIDAISGATITTRAMTNGVNAGLSYFRDSLVKGGVIHE